VATENMGIIFEMFQNLKLAEKDGTLEGRLPENQIIDLTPEQVQLKFNKQPKREDGRRRCLECGVWVKNLPGHITLQHDIEPDDYVIKHQLNPLEPLQDGPEV